GWGFGEIPINPPNFRRNPEGSIRGKATGIDFQNWGQFPVGVETPWYPQHFNRRLGIFRIICASRSVNPGIERDLGMDFRSHPQIQTVFGISSPSDFLGNRSPKGTIEKKKSFPKLLEILPGDNSGSSLGMNRILPRITERFPHEI